MALTAGEDVLYGNPPGASICRHKQGSGDIQHVNDPHHIPEYVKCDWTHVAVAGVHYYKCVCGELSLCPLQPAPVPDPPTDSPEPVETAGTAESTPPESGAVTPSETTPSDGQDTTPAEPPVATQLVP